VPIAVARSSAYRPRRRPFWSSRWHFFTEAGLFLVGAAGSYNVNMIGSIPACEILLFPVLPFLLLARGKRAFDRQYLPFYLATGAWVLGTIIADTYNEIGGYNWIKGLARVGFFILDFLALAIWIDGKNRRMVIFALSISVILAGSAWDYRGAFNVQWKFGLAQSVGIVALLICSYFYEQRRYGRCVVIFLVLAGLSLVYGFRSQLAVLFVSGALIFPLPVRTRRGSPPGEQNLFKVFVLLILAGGAAYAANSVIQYAAKRGFFDESTQAKFEQQAKGDYGVLFGGRPETLVAIQAIRDSPIIGHGSFAYGYKYVELKQDIMYKHGYSDTDDAEESVYPTIPTHSHLTLAWVEGGIFGGICWIYILILTLRALVRLVALRPPLAPLYSYLLIGFVWDILYSPFGSMNRILSAFYILVSYSLLRAPVREARPAIRRVVLPRNNLRQARLAVASRQRG
jgi:hypothetical protein